MQLLKPRTSVTIVVLLLVGVLSTGAKLIFTRNYKDQAGIGLIDENNFYDTNRISTPGYSGQEAVLRVLVSGQLAQGKKVAAFEKRFAELCEVQEAVAVSSGTAALHLALLAHGIGPGDEVITTPFSFAATANVILHVGTTPVFVDIDPQTYNIDPVVVKAAITPRTKAMLSVHL